ncbi:MAG: deoxyribose-phosphate aldolase [Deltaproteobacteria bacterium]|nr:deoxyribose-phosphate aldolase [Deltaproteobacteria bacterium]
MPFSQYIDHTLLKPETTGEQIHQLCEEAVTYQFFSVCVNPFWVSLCKKLLEKSRVKVCTVAGFPLGLGQPSVKAEEAKRALDDGAAEVDMVMNIGAFKSREFTMVQKDIEAVRKAIPNLLLKVILETCLLNHEEKMKACHLAQEGGADFVKTSTGFSTGGATVDDIKLLRETVGSKMGVKASGGIKNLKSALDMIQAGATRIGSSAGVLLVREAGNRVLSV